MGADPLTDLYTYTWSQSGVAPILDGVIKIIRQVIACPENFPASWN